MTITSNPDFGSVAKADFAIDILAKIIKFNHVISGLVIAKVGADPTLTFSIANGTAFISGAFLNIATEANQTVPINQTNKIYLQLSKSGTSPDGGVIGKTTGALPADAIQLAEIITNGTTITTVTDKRDIIDPLVIGYASSLSDFNATKFNGQLRYDTVGKKWQFWDGVAWKSLGGGGMKVRFGFAKVTTIDPTDKVDFAEFDTLFYADQLDTPPASGAAITTIPYNPLMVQTLGGAVATFTDSKEYRGIQAIDFGGKTIGKIIVSVPLSSHAVYSPATSASIKTNATTTKIEILDGVTVKATYTLPADESTSTTSNTIRSLTSTILAVLDAGGIVFTDFRIKVTISTTVSTTTNLTAHNHQYFGQKAFDADSGTQAVRLGFCEVEITG